MNLFSLFFRESATKLLDSLETFTREAEDEHPHNWNGKNMRKYGFKLCQGLKAFAESDYEEAFKLLKPIRHSVYIRTVSSLILFKFGTFDSFLAGLGSIYDVCCSAKTSNKPV